LRPEALPVGFAVPDDAGPDLAARQGLESFSNDFFGDLTDQLQQRLTDHCLESHLVQGFCGGVEVNDASLSVREKDRLTERGEDGGGETQVGARHDSMSCTASHAQ
jgi:hypothetical protein